MAWKIDHAVVRGELDNTVEGKTAGRVWLIGREAPMELELEGDCWRDLAGLRLSFSNPAPRAQEGLDLARTQRGMIGDMTASRKCKVPELAEGESPPPGTRVEDLPFSWRSALYLEWFSEADGRVFLELYDFEIDLSDREWVMDEDAEQAQKQANMQAMRDSVSRDVQRVEPPTGEPEDEYRWEERLKESERMSVAFQQVREKYRDDPDAERKEAFAMSWDGLLDALARKSEGLPEFVPPPDGDEWQEEEIDWAEEFMGEPHPLQGMAHEVVLRGIDLTQPIKEHPEAVKLNQMLMMVGCKLAGALNGSYRPETGFILAQLKRTFGFVNDALAACTALIEEAEDNDHCRALEALKDSIFEIREGIVNIRKELKGN
ncbi:hypothetical protein [Luteolibacter marinus]|uniref:hypothetical protein n=1 Tax=Luteolibacter marinus TaxID=2776705 RepID=UPI0018671C75|nr:hypothetical protein [Luteolibacter marinus]